MPVPSITATSASTALGGYPASKAFDGSATGESWWVSNAVNTGQWLQAQFASAFVCVAYYVTSHDTSNPNQVPHTWDFQGSNDGSSWTTLDSRTSQSYGLSEKREFAVNNSTAYSYYRLANMAGVATYEVIAEFGFRADDESGILATEGTSWFYGPPAFMPRRAFDGNTATWWVSAASSGEVLTWRYGSAITPSAYSVRNHNDLTADANLGPASWTLQGSNNGSTWTTLDTRSGQTWTRGESKSYTVAGSSAYTYLRLNSLTSSGGAYVSIAEVTIETGGVGAAPPAMALTFAMPVPTISLTSPITVAAPVMALSLALRAPTVATAEVVTVNAPAMAVTFALPVPTVLAGSEAVVDAPVMGVTFAMPVPTLSGVVATVPDPTAVARVYTPSGAMALIPLVPATPPAGADLISITRTSVLMGELTEAHPIHERRNCPGGDDTIVREDIGNVHLWIGGTDATFLRGVPTVIRRWESEVPFGDTAAAFEFPQLNPWDADGVGDLEFLTKDAPVHVGIVDPEGGVRRVWSGFLDARGNGLGEGEDYQREAKGTLWAAQHDIREPYPFTTAIDIGVLIARTLNSVVSKRWANMPETPIGIVTLTRGARDQTHWEYVQELLSEAWTDDGRQWTLFEAAPEVFQLRLKPLPSTVDATVAYGTPGVEISLRVDESTRVDGVYARAIAPNKGGWANIFYPATEILNPPPYPNADAGENLSTDAASDTGTGVTDWQTRVVEIGTFDTPAISGTMSAAWVAVAEEVQRSIGVTVDGSVGPQTWNATFDRGGEGIDMRPLRLPLAVKPWVWPTLHTTTGVVSGVNPNYTGTASVPRFIAVDLGADKTKTQGRKIARNILNVYGEAEAFGTAEWVFDPNETDRTRLTHLSNVKVTGHEGEDRVLQVVRKTVQLNDVDITTGQVSSGGSGSNSRPMYVVTTTLDQRARDAMAVEDLLEQKRSAQTDPSRRPGNPTRSSRQVADQRTPWDSESPCGVLRRTAINGDSELWSIVTIPFAEVGKVARISLTATAPFAFAIFASLRITENKLKAIVPNPLTASNPWRPKVIKDQLDEYGVIEAWGELGQRCGYSPETEQDGADFTGDFILDTPVDYWTETPPYVSVAIFMAESGFIKGRFYPAYEGA